MKLKTFTPSFVQHRDKEYREKLKKVEKLSLIFCNFFNALLCWRVELIFRHVQKWIYIKKS